MASSPCKNAVRHIRGTAPRRATTTILVLAAIASLLPAVARASSSISFAGDVMTITDDPGASTRLLGVSSPSTCYARPLPCIRVSPSTYDTVRFPSDRCTDDDIVLECDLPSTLIANLGDSDDSFSTILYAGYSEVHGGSGADTIYGGPGDNDFFGDSGDDLLYGEAGNDRLVGGDGDDWFEPDLFGGEEGQTAGTDVYVGGQGVDRVDYAGRTSALTISVDGVANDGSPGEGDNVGADVEQVIGGGGADTLLGNDARNELDGRGGNDALLGAAGDDDLYGGRDDDRLSGGDGQDKLVGEAGNDDLDGGAGIDDFTGDDLVEASGIDRITARDGVQEHINCGPGEDTAIVDDIDVVVDDLSLRWQCEHVDRGAAAPPAPPPAAPSPDRTSPELTGLSVASLRLGRTTKVRFKLSERATVTFTVQRRTRRKGTLRYVAVAGSFRHGGSAGPNTRKFDGRLARRRLKVGRYRLKAVATDAAGNTSRPKHAELRVRRG